MLDIMQALFDTKAIKFCEENKPFWYTSGKIGPYFINTHYIYGSEKDASELLSFIDECLENKKSLPQKVFKQVLKQYNENMIYHNLIETMKNYIIKNINIDEIDYISGGERRDWFFSNIISYLLGKPHISIYKDLSVIITDSNFENIIHTDNIENKKILHIADLITVASSYIRNWIPAIKNIGGKMCWSCVVVDRMQGGKEALKNENIKSLSLVNVDKHLFETAYKNGIINLNQLDMLNNFFENPDQTMRNFLINHPEFLESSLNGDEKTAKRAKLLIEQNLYNLN